MSPLRRRFPPPASDSEWRGGWLLVSASERGVGWGRLGSGTRGETPHPVLRRCAAWPTLPAAREGSRGGGRALPQSFVYPATTV